jgi:hypothetical protein
MNSANYEVDAKFEVFTAVEIEVEFLWVRTPRNVVVGYNLSTLRPLYLDDGGNKVLRNVGILPQHYMASLPPDDGHI